MGTLTHFARAHAAIEACETSVAPIIGANCRIVAKDLADKAPVVMPVSKGRLTSALNALVHDVVPKVILRDGYHGPDMHICLFDSVFEAFPESL